MRIIVTKKKMLLFPELNLGTMWAGYQLAKGVTAKKGDNVVVILSATDPHTKAVSSMNCFCSTFGKTADQFLDEIERLNKETEEIEYDPDSEQ